MSIECVCVCVYECSVCVCVCSDVTVGYGYLCGERGVRVVGGRVRGVRGGRRRRRVVGGGGVLDHLLVDELLPLLDGVLALVHRVVVRGRGRLEPSLTINTTPRPTKHFKR